MISTLPLKLCVPGGLVMEWYQHSLWWVKISVRNHTYYKTKALDVKTHYVIWKYLRTMIISITCGKGWKYRHDIFTLGWRSRGGQNIVSHRHPRWPPNNIATNEDGRPLQKYIEHFVEQKWYTVENRHIEHQDSIMFHCFPRAPYQKNNI